eukprot:scaffold48772_cov71-Phaeocystis_antarctica.AAC.3
MVRHGEYRLRAARAARERRDHDEVEVERLGVAPDAVAPDGRLERRTLLLALGREARIPVLHAWWTRARPRCACLFRGSSPEWHVLRVPNEEDPLAAFLEEEAIAALLVVPEAVGVDVREEVRGGASVAVGVRLKVEGHGILGTSAARPGNRAASRQSGC